MSTKSHRHSSSKSSKSSCGKSAEYRVSSKQKATGLSFLFAVVELNVNYESPVTSEVGIPHDEWQNALPPRHREQYGNDMPSEVMRFHDGRISRASSESVEYSWVRRDHHGEGGILKRFGETCAFLWKYKSASVFSCNPLLPIVFARDDYSINVGPLHALQFLHCQGISKVSYPDEYPCLSSNNAPPAKFVAGRHPSWMPNLVPAAYENPYRVGQSQGLGGDLAVVLGLMAFQSAHPMYEDQDRRTINEVFLGRHGEGGGLWKDYRWRGDRRGVCQCFASSTPLFPLLCGGLCALWWKPSTQKVPPTYLLTYSANRPCFEPGEPPRLPRLHLLGRREPAGFDRGSSAEA